MTECAKTLKHVRLDLDGEPWSIPYWEVESGKPGPCLLVCAAVHGNEIMGAPAIVRWVQELPATLLRGRVLALPFASLPAVRIGQQAEIAALGKLQVWPGAPDGNRKEQVYHALHRDLVVQATHAIDLHAYNEVSAAEALAREDRPASIELGLAAALPFTRIIAVPPGGRENFPPPPGGKIAPCTLERLMSDSGRIGITLEYSGQGRLYPAETQRALDSLRRMAAHLGLVPEPDQPPRQTVRFHAPRDNERSVKITAPGYGLLVTGAKKPGDDIEKDEVFAEWIPEDSLTVQPLCAPVRGRFLKLGVSYPKDAAAAAGALPRPTNYPFAAPGAILAEIFPTR